MDFLLFLLFFHISITMYEYSITLQSVYKLQAMYQYNVSGPTVYRLQKTHDVLI